MENVLPKPVAVAVSGGVDSLFCLLRLKEAGLPVVAVHGLFLPEAGSDLSSKGMGGTAEKLAALCAGLGVPFHCLDCAEAFLRRVIAPFVRGYARGITPNPCVICNAAIKFGVLRERAMALGAGALATGHYALLVHEPGRRPSGPEDARAAALLAKGARGEEAGVFPALLEGADPAKDQSYFLCLTPLSGLERTLLPLGEVAKATVVRLLEQQGLAAPVPRESQEVCFVPGDEYRGFLPGMARRLGVELPGPGPMLLADGRRLGTHQGLWRYTEGQRRGLGIGWKEPLHVVSKEHEGNILRLGPKTELEAIGCSCGEINILVPPETWPATVLVKTRYRERPRAANVRVETDENGMARMDARFLESVRAVAPGQAAAVYLPVPGLFHADGRPWLRLAAGGVIRAVLKGNAGL